MTRCPLLRVPVTLIFTPTTTGTNRSLPNAPSGSARSSSGQQGASNNTNPAQHVHVAALNRITEERIGIRWRVRLASGYCCIIFFAYEYIVDKRNKFMTYNSNQLTKDADRKCIGSAVCRMALFRLRWKKSSRTHVRCPSPPDRGSQSANRAFITSCKTSALDTVTYSIILLNINKDESHTLSFRVSQV